MALVAAPPMMRPQQPHQALAALWPDAPVAVAAAAARPTSTSTSTSASASASASTSAPSAPSAPRRSGVLKLIRNDYWQKHHDAQLKQRHAIAKHRSKEAVVREAMQKEAARAKQDARDKRVTADDAFAEKCRREKPKPVAQLAEHRIKAVLADKDPATGRPKPKKTDAERLVEACSAAQILAKLTYPTISIEVEHASQASKDLEITTENRQEEMMKALSVPGARVQLAKARQRFARARAQEREAELAAAAEGSRAWAQMQAQAQAQAQAQGPR